MKHEISLIIVRRWARHVVRMGVRRVAYFVLERKSEVKWQFCDLDTDGRIILKKR